MDMNTLIYLPVSLGEAIDKLTILDIKLDKITDNRKTDVFKERDLLYETLRKFIIKYNDLYQSMKKVNLLLWDMMDILRDGDYSNDEYIKISKKCIEYNDIRFRIKYKINNTSNSQIKEQKGYKITRCLIEINNNITNIYEFIKPIKYYSFFYEEIIIIYSGQNTLLIDEFANDTTIIISDTSNKDEYKTSFTFKNNQYDQQAILDIFQLDDDVMNTLLSS
jgi:hypothetical protein